MKRLFVFLMLATTCICADLSAGAEQWAKTYGDSNEDRACRVQKTEDGGYIIAGSTSSFSAGENDLWLLKFDSNSDISWQKTYGGIGNDYAADIQQVKQGGYIVVGTTYSFGAGGSDIWVLRLDGDGDILWQKTYGGASFDWPASIQPISDGGYVVTGGSYSFGAGEDDLWVFKLDSQGNVAWQKTYGGEKSDYATSIQPVDDGFIVVGNTSSFGAGKDDLLVLKLDNHGEIPDCRSILDCNASVSDTLTIAAETDCRVESTLATITNTTVLPQDSSAKIRNEFCGIGKGNFNDDGQRLNTKSQMLFFSVASTCAFRL